MASHSDRPLADDALVAPRMFLVIGGFLVALTVLYWFTAYEEAGTAMLAGSGLLAVWSGFYLWLRWRLASGAAPSAEAAEGAGAAHVEPADHTALAAPPSIWPFVIGSGAALLVDGLVLGNWILLPGLLLTVLGIVGFIVESRP